MLPIRLLISRRSAGFAFAVLALIAVSAVTRARPTRADEGLRRCVRVIDGDTIVLDGGERVRLIGVDTPETKDPRKPVQYFGREASAFTKRMVEGRSVRLERGWERTDKYGRTLAYVFRADDGLLLNAVLLRDGYGHATTRFPHPRMEEFRALERRARGAGRGLWGQEGWRRP